MKIAYLLHNNEVPEASGILRWVVMETGYWISAGHEARIFLYSWRNYTSAELGGIPVTVRQYSSMPDRFRKVAQIAQDIIAFQPDVVRLTYDPYYPGMKPLLKRVPTVLDVHSDDIFEYKLGAKHRDWYNRLTRNQLFRHAQGLVFVTHEMATRKHLNPFDKPYTVIANSIDLSQYEHLPPAQNNEPRLAFVGTSGQAWHGLDKILWLARQFPKWHFDLIGPTLESLGVDIPPNVIPHGHLSRSEYQQLFAQADIALGTLALHRKGMDEACAYKVREYCAYGLPTIIGYKDTDFPDSYPFICQLPNTEDNVQASMQQIEHFVMANKGKRIPRESVAHLDLEAKESRRLSFFEELITQSS